MIIPSNESWFWNNKQAITGWFAAHLPEALKNGKNWTAMQVKPTLIHIKGLTPSLKIVQYRKNVKRQLGSQMGALQALIRWIS